MHHPVLCTKTDITLYYRYLGRQKLVASHFNTYGQCKVSYKTIENLKTNKTITCGFTLTENVT